MIIVRGQEGWGRVDLRFRSDIRENNGRWAMADRHGHGHGSGSSFWFVRPVSKFIVRKVRPASKPASGLNSLQV